MLWHELKESLRKKTKPHNKEDSIKGIMDFWNTVNVPKSQKYIGHLRKICWKLEMKGEGIGFQHAYLITDIR